MENFSWTNPTIVYFGKGMQDKVAGLIKRFSDKVLVVSYSKDFLESLDLFGITESFSESGIITRYLYGVTPNPKLSFVNEGIEICKKEGIGFVLGIGGGSAIDATKAIAFGACYDGDVWDFFENKKVVDVTLCTGNILTLASAGSETNWSCVVTNDTSLVKGIVNSHLIHPKFSVMNPEFMLNAPIEQVKYGIADIYAHFVERYFTNSVAEISTSQCEAVMKSLVEIASYLKENDLNYEICSELMWASKISQDDSLEVGKYVDWTSHILSHSVGVALHLPHAVAVSILMNSWLEFMSKNKIGKDKLFRYSKNVFQIKDKGNNDKTVIGKGLEKTLQFFLDLEIPVTFTGAQVKMTDELVDIVCNYFPKGLKRENSFCPLEQKDIREILELSK